MAEPTTGIFFNSTTPAAPSGNQNVKPQSDGGTPQQSVSFYPQVATASLLGVVQPDGTTITIASGVISAASSGVSYGQGDAAATSGNNTITLGSIPIAGSLSIFVGGAILRPSTGYTVASDVISLTDALAGGAIVVVNWATTSSTPGGITLSTTASAPAFVQGASSYVASASSIALAFSGNNAAGNCLIACIIMTEPYGGAGGLSVTDANGNTWTSVTAAEQNNCLTQMFVAPNCAAGANTVTVSYSGGSGRPFALAILEYSNVATASPVDASTYAQAENWSNLPMVPSLTTSLTGDLLLLFCSCENTPTFSTSPTWTSRQTYSGSLAIDVFDDVAGAAGTYSNTVTATNSFQTYQTAILVALKPA